jgi:hypothetical protein
MNVAVVSNSAAQGQTGLWFLAIFLLGLSAMAWLTVREASLYETKAAIRNLRRGRKAKPNIPASEQLNWASQCTLFIRMALRGGDITKSFTQVIGEGEYGFEFRLRREIDKITGKDVYHGQKEQL